MKALILLLLSALAAPAASITLVWDPVPPSSNYVVAGYTVFYGPTGTNGFLATNTVHLFATNLTYTATVEPGRRYFFFVKARGQNGDTSEPSNVVYDTLPAPQQPPPAPRNLRVTSRQP